MTRWKESVLLNDLQVLNTNNIIDEYFNTETEKIKWVYVLEGNAPKVVEKVDEGGLDEEEKLRDYYNKARELYTNKIKKIAKK